MLEQANIQIKELKPFCPRLHTRTDKHLLKKHFLVKLTSRKIKRLKHYKQLFFVQYFENGNQNIFA